MWQKRERLAFIGAKTFGFVVFWICLLRGSRDRSFRTAGHFGHIPGELVQSTSNRNCGCTESIVYAVGQWRNVMSGNQSRMVQHNDTELTVAPQGPSKTAGLPPPCPVVPTHFRTFQHQQDCEIITQAMHYLSQSGFYWGPLEVDEAHAQLAKLPLGTFLIRDSMQTNVFFTLSYQAPEGPTSVRMLLKDGSFSLAGSKHTFPCLFALLAYYIASPKNSLSKPYRGATPQSLQNLARRAVMSSCRKEGIQHLPLSRNLKEFLLLYPYSI